MKNKLKSNSLRLLIPLFLILLITLTVLLIASNVKKPQTYDSKAASSLSGLSDAGVRGSPGDLWADVILGQPDFTDGIVRERVANHLFNPGGVLVDRSIRPNRVYIADGGNSRILAYKSLGTCSNSSSTKCTDNDDCTSPGTCTLVANKNADKVFGQPDFSHGACNGDASFTTYPVNAPASTDSLCLMPQGENSPGEGGQFISMAADANHNLYVPDPHNNRVLMFKDPFGAVSGGAGDTTADFVWGQTNFTSIKCNNDKWNPGNASQNYLCISEDSSTVFHSGVDIDLTGNLWVTDTINKRVLRYAYNSTLGRPENLPNLVLGQPDFTSNGAGTGLNQLYFPGGVKVHPNGTVFVLDTYQPDHGRILTFTPPLTNGMNGVLWGDPAKPFWVPSGIEFSLDGNSVWINDSLNYMVEKWSLTGSPPVLQNILYKDAWSGYPDIITWTGVPCEKPNTVCHQDGTRGGIGMTSNGDLFLSSSANEQDVIRFKAPIRNLTPGTLTSSDFRLFPPLNPVYPAPNYNKLTLRSFGSPLGVEAYKNQYGDQLIVADNWRLMFWNNASLQSFSNFSNASGIINSSNHGDYIDPFPYGRIRADKSGHLFVLHGPQIEIFNLPLTASSIPVKIIGLQLKDLNNFTIDLAATEDEYTIGGLFPAADGSYLWVTHRGSNRTFRIRNPLGTNPRVDVILGQQNSSGSNCNQGNSTPTNSTLCQPGAVSMDKLGNLYVADNSLEINGNYRLLRFNASKIPTNNSAMNYAPAADYVFFNGIATNEPVFDSENRLMIGFNQLSFSNSKNSIEYFNDILTSGWNNPTGIFNDYIKTPYSMDFDENNNLYVADLNRSKVLKYKTPFASVPGPTLTLTPTPFILPPTYTPTPTNQPPGACTWTPAVSTCTDSTKNCYCPDASVTRAQMAVFLLKALNMLNRNQCATPNYLPPAVGSSTGFTDVAVDFWAAAWIKDFAGKGITSGCGPGIYCPDSNVTRAQMAVFLLKAEHGPSYTPPAIGANTGFTDVPLDYWAAAWIKQLVAEGITSGCGTGIFCPDAAVTRAQMSVFILKLIGLSYGYSSYTPPEVNSNTCFADVTPAYWAASWIKQFGAEGITGGCGTVAGGACTNSNKVEVIGFRPPSPTPLPSLIPAPVCSRTTAQSATTTAVSGTFYAYAYGVNNASSVYFPTWSEVNGQDDIIWYQGVDLGGGLWRASINLASHPGLGKINVHVYLNRSVFCNYANFTRLNTITNSPVPPTPIVLPQPAAPTLTCGAYNFGSRSFPITIKWKAQTGAKDYWLQSYNASRTSWYLNKWVGNVTSYTIPLGKVVIPAGQKTITVKTHYLYTDKSNHVNQSLFSPESSVTCNVPSVPTGFSTPTISGQSPAPTGAGKSGDANNDNKVDGLDYVIWLNNYNQQATGAGKGDFNGNSFVDGLDYVIWLNNYNK